MYISTTFSEQQDEDRCNLESEVIFDPATNSYIFDCPSCAISVVVRAEELACKILRCGISKADGAQMPPHLDQASCEHLVNSDLIYGCAKPFQFVDIGDGSARVRVCGYI